MSRLAANIAKIVAMKGMAPAAVPDSGPSPLCDLDMFGTNPGALKAKVYVPADIAEKPALVVVLHGCTQTAAGYDRGSGWSQLADEHGFALLFPEQQRSNNPNLCFSWFSPGDTARDRGEALSIRQMIDTMVDRHDIDISRIFVTGLSAGGAMTSVLLAAYPELFAGGAIIAGLPHGSAATVPQALEAMRKPSSLNSRQWGDHVRRTSDHAGPWPRISVWHGTADMTVDSANADAIIDQWLSVHGLDDRPSATEQIAGHRHRIWKDASGRSVIEDYRIANMGHGTPLATTGDEACGTAMPHMLEAGISSTRRIAASWALLGEKSQRPAARPIEADQADGSHKGIRNLPAGKVARLEPTSTEPSHPTVPGKAGVGHIIENALRAAGLMR